MAHFDKHSTSIKALVDVSEAMLNAMEQHGIDPETVANRNEFTVMIHFLKSIIDGELNIVDEEVKIGWKIFGMGKEFTKTDKLIYIISYVWNISWFIVFIIGTVYNLSNPVSDISWMKYWGYFVHINLVYSFFIIIWFTIGGFMDLKQMISSLKSSERDHADDGWVGN